MLRSVDIVVGVVLVVVPDAFDRLQELFNTGVVEAQPLLDVVHDPFVIVRNAIEKMQYLAITLILQHPQ